MSPVAMLRFLDLLPEHDEFELKDGTKVQFRARREFNAADLGRLQAIEEKRRAALEVLKTDPTNTSAASEFDAAIDDFVRFVLPGLPEDVIRSLYLGQKTEILEWWTERNKPGKQEAGQPGNSWPG